MKKMNNLPTLYSKNSVMLKPLLCEIKKHVKKGHTVIDVGCGSGLYIKPLLNAIGKEGKLICIDSNKDMVAYCKKRFHSNNLKIVKLPSEKLSSLKEKVDVVFASLVLQFTKVKKPIREIRKILKKGGKLIFSIPLHRVGITIGVDDESKEFKRELEKNLKNGLKNRNIHKKVSFDYPLDREALLKSAISKKYFRICKWDILPIERSGLKDWLDFYKVPFRSQRILKLPFNQRYEIITTALKNTFKKYPDFKVKRYYLIATVINNG